MDSQHVAGDNNVQVLVKDSMHVYVRIGGEPRAVSLWVPPFREAPPEGANRDLALLLATTTITKLVGRQGLWNDCIAWCSAPEIVSAFCLTGRGGSGKTRFALELVHALRELNGWDARFVRFRKSEAFDLWTETAGGNHVLLVFDYASDNAAAIAESLRQLTEQPRTDATQRLRILLLARTASWESGWLQQFEPTSGSDFSQSPRRLFRTEPPRAS